MSQLSTRHAVDLDLREIAEARHRRVEQGSQDPRLSFGEFAPDQWRL